MTEGKTAGVVLLMSIVFTPEASKLVRIVIAAVARRFGCSTRLERTNQRWRSGMYRYRYPYVALTTTRHVRVRSPFAQQQASRMNQPEILSTYTGTVRISMVTTYRLTSMFSALMPTSTQTVGSSSRTVFPACRARNREEIIFGATSRPPSAPFPQ